MSTAVFQVVSSRSTSGRLTETEPESTPAAHVSDSSRKSAGANIASAMPSLKAAGPLSILLVFIGFSMITVRAFWTPTRLGSR